MRGKIIIILDCGTLHLAKLKDLDSTGREMHFQIVLSLSNNCIPFVIRPKRCSAVQCSAADCGQEFGNTVGRSYNKDLPLI